MEIKIGDKVKIPQGEIGYLIEKEIDPLEVLDVNFEKTNPFCKIRVFRNIWINGYFDFRCMYNELQLVEEKDFED